MTVDAVGRQEKKRGAGCWVWVSSGHLESAFVQTQPVLGNMEQCMTWCQFHVRNYRIINLASRSRLQTSIFYLKHILLGNSLIGLFCCNLLNTSEQVVSESVRNIIGRRVGETTSCPDLNL